MFNSYNYKDVLTRASLTIQIIDDTTLYKASIFSANGNIFNINDKSSQISLLVQKGLEDITDQFTDIVWSRFNYKSNQYEEDLEWGKQHYGKKTFILYRDDILEKANIQVAVYAQIDGVKTLVAADYISFTDINDMQGSEIPPASPKHGDLWLDVSVTPPRLMMWDDTLKKWVEVVMSGNDKRNLLRNSNFYKNSFDFWLKLGNPTLEIESLSGKKWARLLCNNITAINNGISQTISAAPKSNYSFQMICKTYVQSQFPNGDVLVSAYSINNTSQKTLLKEVSFDINNEVKNYNFSFSSLQDTERIEVIISNKLNQQCDIMLTNTKLEKSLIPNEWEIAIEDIQDALDNKVGNSPEEVFNSLTDGGKMQGVYIDVDEQGNKNYYFNASYIKSGYIYGERIDAKNLLVKRKDGVDTLKIDEYGNIFLKGNIQFEADGVFVDPATKEDISYKVEIESTNGFVFYNGQIQTELIAKVYLGKNEVTDIINESKFQWTKTNSDGTIDEAWSIGKNLKSIHISKQDVQEKATFSCYISE